MSEPSGGPPPRDPSDESKSAQSPQQSQANSTQNAGEKGKADVNAATTEPPTLSNAELKAKQKAEKQARRAQAKAVKEPVTGGAASSAEPTQKGAAGNDGKADKDKKGKPDGAVTAKTSGSAHNTSAPRSAAATAATATAIAYPASEVPECFSHLPVAKQISITEAGRDVHPTVLLVGQQMGTFAIDESIARLEATLLAFKELIKSYVAPEGHSLARHFTPHVLNSHIEYLTECRPMSFAMGNAIRWLKLQVTKIDIDCSEDDARRDLCAAIDIFLTERVLLAGRAIVKSAAGTIQDDDVVLVYGQHSLVERALLSAHKQGKQFSMIIIDDPYLKSGQTLAEKLSQQGIEVLYAGDLGGLTYYAQQATKVLFGAASVFSNGALYAPAGTCDVALAAHELGKPVTALCETINITDRVTLDSLTYNEIDPEASSTSGFRLLFDTTPSGYLTHVITEQGVMVPTAAPNLLRKLEENN